MGVTMYDENGTLGHRAVIGPGRNQKKHAIRWLAERPACQTPQLLLLGLPRAERCSSTLTIVLSTFIPTNNAIFI